MTKKTILITGGIWYIGSHAVVAFEQAGYTTVSIDNLSNSSMEVLENIEKILGYTPIFHRVDITDSVALEAIFQKYTFDGVIHFAGLKSVGESCEFPLRYHRNNIFGSMVLFEVMEKFNVKKIVFSSSATVYSTENTPPLTESSKLGTTNAYGTSKLVIEYLLKDLATHANFRVIPLRYFNPIGAHPSGYIWEKPNGIPNNLLPYVLDVASGKREKVRVFGNTYPTPDGTGVRDYIDVNDLVEVHLIAYKKLDEIAVNDIFFLPINIGTGRGTSVLEIIQSTAEITKKPIPFEIVEPRAGDLGSVYAWVDVAKTVLWWEAKKSIQDSLLSGWNFVRNQ